MQNKKSINFVSKLLLSATLALVAFFAVCAFSFGAFSKGNAPVSLAAGYNYGEVRIECEDGSILVLTSNSFTGASAVAGGGQVDLYVVVENGTRIPSGKTSPVPATFKTDASGKPIYGAFNYMVSYLSISGTKAEPNLRNAPLQFVGDNKTGSTISGGYDIKYNCPIYNGITETAETETRYLVHSYTIDGTNTAPRAFFSYTQATSVEVWCNSSKHDSLSFTHYSVNGEPLESVLSGNRITDNATHLISNSKNNKLFGWYNLEDKNNPTLITTENDYYLESDCKASSREVSLGAVVYSTASVNLGSSTLSSESGVVGGTASITVEKTAFNKEDNITKMFLSNASGASFATEEFVLSSGKITLSAKADSGYQFMGWFNGDKAVSNRSSYVLPFLSVEDDSVLEARFAKTIDIKAITSTDGLNNNIGGYAVFDNNETYYGAQKTLIATPNTNYLFDGFYVNGDKLTQENIQSLLGADAKFVGELKRSITFTQTQNAIIEARFVTGSTITLNSYYVANGFELGFFDIDLYQDVIQVYVNNQLQTITTEHVSSGKLVLTVAKDSVVKLVINTGSRMYNFNSIKNDNTTLISGEDHYMPNTKEYSYQFTASASIDLTAHFNPRFINTTVKNQNYSLLVSVFPLYNSDNIAYGVMRICLEIVPNVGNIFEGATLVVSGEDYARFADSVINIDNTFLANLNSAYGLNLNMVDLLKIVLSTPTEDGYSVADTGDAALDSVVAKSEALGYLRPQLSVIYSVSSLAYSPELNEDINLSVVGAYLSGSQITNNLTGVVGVKSGSWVDFVAQKSFELNGTTYAFSHFTLDGAYLVGLGSSTNGNVTLTSSSNGYAVSIKIERNMQLVAVYRQVVSVSTSSNTNGKADLSSKVLLNGGASSSFALGSSVVVTTTDADNFSHFVVTTNGNSVVHTASSISVVVEQGMQVVAYFKTEVNTTPLSGVLNYTNGSFSVQKSSAAGSVFTSKEVVKYGDEVSLSALAKNGYVFVGWYSLFADNSFSYDNLTLVSRDSITKVSADAEVRFVGLFAPAASVAVESNTGASVNINGNITKHYVGYIGETIIIEADSNNFLYFASVNLDGTLKVLTEDNSYTFVLSYNTSVVAVYGNRSLSISSWSNGNISVDGGSVSVNFGDGRILSGSSVSGRFAYSQTNSIVISALAKAGFVFVGWYSDAAFINLVSTQSELTLPSSSDVLLYACFKSVYNFSVTASESSGAALPSGMVSGVPQNGTAMFGDKILLQAHSVFGYKFKGFEITQNGTTITKSSSEVEIVVNADTKVVAVYEKCYSLSVSSNVDAQISVILNGEEITNLTEFSGENVTISVKFNKNTARFLHFYVNGNQFNGDVVISDSQVSINIDVNNNMVIIAEFQSIATLSSGVETIGSDTEVGGTVTLTDAAGSGFVSGNEATINAKYTAVATAAEGYRFVGFKVEGTFVPSSELSSSTLSFSLKTATIVTAVFAKEITLSISVSGNGCVYVNGTEYKNGSSFVTTYGSEVGFVYVANGGNALQSVSIPKAYNAGASSAYVTAIEDITCEFVFTNSYNVNIVSGTPSQNANISYLPTGSEQPVKGNALQVPNGNTITLTAPLFADGFVFVGFYVNGSYLSTSYSFVEEGSNGMVAASLTVTSSAVIEARYAPCTNMYISGIDGNSIIDADSLNITAMLNGNDAPWIMDSARVVDNRLMLVVPTTLKIELTASGAGFSGWYFVTNASSSGSTYNINLLNSSITVGLYAGEVSANTPNAYLLCAFNTNQTNIGETTSGFIKDSEHGVITENGGVYTAEAEAGYTFAYFEVQIGLAASSLWLRITNQNGVTIVRGENGIVSVSKGDDNIYNGYAYALRAVFVKSVNGDFLAAIDNFNNANNGISFVGNIPLLTNPNYDNNPSLTGTRVTLVVVPANGGNAVMPTLSYVRAVFGSQAYVSGNAIVFYLENLPASTNFAESLDTLAENIKITLPISVGVISNNQRASVSVSIKDEEQDSQTGVVVNSDTKVTAFAKDLKYDSELKYYYKDIDQDTRLVFVGWYNGEQLVSSSAQYTFAAKESVVLEARFAVYYKVTIGSNLFEDSDSEYYVKEGSAFSVNMPINSNQEFSGFSIVQNNGAPALFLPVSDAQIEKTDAGFSYSFEVKGATKVVAVYNKKQTVQLEVQNNGSAAGKVYVNGTEFSGSLELSSAGVVSLSAVAESGLFAGWYEVIDGNMRLISSSQTIQVSIEGKKGVIAVSKDATNIVAVYRDQAQLSITSNVKGANAVIVGAIGVGQNVKLTAPSLDGYQFVGWYENGEIVSPALSINRILKAENYLQMVYAPLFSFELVKDGNGSVLVNGSASYPAQVSNNSTISLSATADSGYVFVGFYVNGVLLSKEAQIELVVSSNVSVKAVFAKVVTVNINSSNASVLGVLSSGIMLSGGLPINAFSGNEFSLTLSKDAAIQLLGYVTFSNGVLVSYGNKAYISQSVDVNSNLSFSFEGANKNEVAVSVSGQFGANTFGGGVYSVGEEVEVSYVLPETHKSFDSLTGERLLRFIGWYDASGNLVSTEGTYKFVIDGSFSPISLQARFVEYLRVETVVATLGSATGAITLSGENGELSKSQCVQVNSQLYYVQTGTKVVVNTTASNGVVLGLFANDTLLNHSSSVLNSQLSATISVGSSTVVSASVAQLVEYIFSVSGTIPSVGGCFGVLQFTMPTTNVTQELQLNGSTISVLVPFGSSISVVANENVGCQFIGWKENGVLVSSDYALSVEAASPSQFEACFTRAFSLVLEAYANSGEELSINSSVSIFNNVASVTLPLLNENNESLSYLLYVNSVGLSRKIELNNSALGQVFGNSANISLSSDQAVLEGLALFEDCTLVAVYQTRASLSVKFQANDSLLNASFAIEDVFGNAATDLYFGNSYKLVLPQEITDGGKSYRLVSVSVSGRVYTASELYFTAQKQNVVVATYLEQFSVSVQAGVLNGLVISANTAAGHVFGNGSYLSTQSAVLTAVANNGYKFIGWYDADNNLLSTEEVLRVGIASDKPVYAAFIDAFSLILQASGGSVFGSFESTLGGTASILSDGNVAKTMVQKGTTVLLTIKAKDGYKFVSLKQNGKEISCTFENGEYKAEIVVNENLTLTAEFKKELNINFVVVENYKDAPANHGYITYNGEDIYNSFIATVLKDNRVSFSVVSPTDSNYTLVGVYVGGKLIESTSNVYSFTASQDVTVRVVFAQMVEVSVSVSGSDLSGNPFSQDTLKSQVEYTNNGQTLTPNAAGKISVLFGEALYINVSSSKTAILLGHKVNGSDNLVTNNPFQITIDESVSSIQTVFEQPTRVLSLYFPVSVRNFKSDSSFGTANAPTISMFVYKNNALWLIVTKNTIYNAAKEKVTDSNIVLNADYLQLALGQGFAEELSVEFGIENGGSVVSSKRTRVLSPNGDVLSSSYEKNADDTIIDNTIAGYVVVDSKNALSTSKNVNFSFTNYVLVEATHNNPHQNSYLLQFMGNDVNKTTQVLFDKGSMFISAWVPVGTTVSLSAKPAATQENANLVVPSMAVFNSLLLSDLDFIANWKTAADFPQQSDWETTSSQAVAINNTRLSFVATRDTGVVADYLKVWQVKDNQKVLTVAGNSTATGTGYIPVGGIVTNVIKHGSQVFNYTINSVMYVPNQHFGINVETVLKVDGLQLYYAGAGMLINGDLYIDSIEKNADGSYKIYYYSLKGSSQLKTAAYSGTGVLLLESNDGSVFAVHGIASATNGYTTGYVLVGSYANKVELEEGYILDYQNTNVQLLGSVKYVDKVVNNEGGEEIILPNFTSESINKDKPGTVGIDASIAFSPIYDISESGFVASKSDSAKVDSTDETEQTNVSAQVVGTQSVQLSAPLRLTGEHSAQLMGFMLVNTFDGNITTDQIVIKPNGTDSYIKKENGDKDPTFENGATFGFSSNTFISVDDSQIINGFAYATISVHGGIKVVAVYERDLYIITPYKRAMYKTDINGNVSIDGINIVINSQSVQNANDKLLAQGSDTVVTHVLKANNDINDNTYYVFTQNESSNGTIKGSLVFESGDTAEINATVYHYGEFAGYEFTSDENEDFSIPATLKCTPEIADTSVILRNGSLIAVNRDPQTDIPYSLQQLSFKVNQNLNMYAYFSTLRYRVTVSFAEFVNTKDSVHPDKEVLFNTATKEDSSNQGVRDEWLTLSSYGHYLQEANNEVLKNGLLKVVNDVDQTIPFVVTREIADDGTVKNLKYVFNVDAKAGAGFSGFKIVLNRSVMGVSGSTYIYAPLEDSVHQTISDIVNYASLGIVSDKSITQIERMYNNSIGSTSDIQPNDYTSYVKNPEIVIATNKNVKSIKSGSGDRANGNRQMIVVKNANRFYEQIKDMGLLDSLNGYMSASVPVPKDTLDYEASIDLIQSQYGKFQVNNKEEFDKFQKVFKSYVGAIILANTRADAIDTSIEPKDRVQKSYFEVISSLFDDAKNNQSNTVLGDHNSNLKYKVRLENGRYLTLNGGRVTPDFAEFDSMYNSYEINANGSVVLSDGKGNSTTLPLIIELTVDLSKIDSGVGKLTDIEPYVVELYMYNQENTESSSSGYSPVIRVDQNDMVFSRDIVLSEQTLETYNPQDFVNDASGNIRGKYWYHFGRTTSTNRGHDYFRNATVSFTGMDEQRVSEIYLTNSGMGYLARSTKDAIDKWSVWDAFYNNIFKDTISDKTVDRSQKGLWSADNKFVKNPASGCFGYQHGGAGRYESYIYAYFANDKQTADLSSDIVVKQQLTNNGAEEDIINLGYYDPIFSSWEETWASFVVGFIYAAIIFVAAITIASTGGAAAIFWGAVIAGAGALIGSALDATLMEAITQCVTRIKDIPSQRSYYMSLVTQSAVTYLATGTTIEK